MKKLGIKIGVIALVLMMSMAFIGCDTGGGGGGALFTNPGVFTAEAPGFSGLITVEAEYSRQRIVSVRVISHSETEAFAMVPIQRIPADMIRYQVLEVEVVSGATMTSRAIINAVFDTAEQAGGNLTVLGRSPTPAPGEPSTIEAEVLVVGSGVSGLFAAFEAARSGADVVLIEKLGFFGGTTATSGGIMQGVNNPILRNHDNIHTDSADAYFEFLYDLSLGRANLSMLRHIANLSQDTIEHTIRMGVQFNNTRHLEHLPIGSERRLFDFPSGDPRHPSRALWANRMGDLETTGYLGAGSFITIPIVNYLEEQGVRFYNNMRAMSLIQAPNGTVTGVNAQGRSGTAVTIQADSVILATGGFADNPTLMSEFHPMIEQAGRGHIFWTLAGANGDGLLMGRAAGAATLSRRTPISEISLIPDYGIWVTPGGVRYKDEAFLYPMATTGELFNLGYYFQWTIMNNTNRPDNLTASAPGTVNTAPGAVFTHANIEGLAALIGLDPVVLQQTINDYDAQVTTDEAFGDDDFELRTLAHKSRFAVNPTTRHQPIGTAGPFWAQRSGGFGGLIVGTRGGLKIDIDGRVLDINGRPIQGLFAAGEVANAETLPIKYGGSGMALNVYANMARRAGMVAATGTWIAP